MVEVKNEHFEWKLCAIKEHELDVDVCHDMTLHRRDSSMPLTSPIYMCDVTHPCV